MMNYPPAVHRSSVVHPPRASWKPTQEKGHLIGPAGPSALQGAWRGENPAGIDDHQHQLANMCLTEQGASPHLCHPCYPPYGVAPMIAPSAVRGPQDMLSTPLEEHILDYNPTRGFSIPPFTMYDGSFDPYDHMLHYNQAMILNADDDRLLCKVFPASLKGPALVWFHKLPRGSINTFGELWATFVSQYLCSARQKGNISSLKSIFKLEDESIWDFTRRFGQAVQQIDIYSMDAVLQNFRRSFGPTCNTPSRCGAQYM